MNAFGNCWMSYVLEILVSKFVLFGIHFGSFWKLLETIFAPLRPPGAPPGPWGTLGTSQDSPRSVYESLLGPSGADFGPTWPQHEPTWSQLGLNLAPT